MIQRRISIKIFGKVQGVWFRKHVASSAQVLKISGFVKNVPDGSVYAEAQGQQHEIDELIRACELGSPQSKVERVEVKPLDPNDGQTGFKIAY